MNFGERECCDADSLDLCGCFYRSPVSCNDSEPKLAEQRDCHAIRGYRGFHESVQVSCR